MDAEYELLDDHASVSADSDDDGIEVFSDDDDQNDDTTAVEARNGKDIQGIPWRRLGLTREDYRETRLQNYKNYVNVDVPLDMIKDECKEVDKGHAFYDFYCNSRGVRSSIVHFQLRNLLCATSKHDVYVNYRNCIMHYSDMTRRSSPVLDLSTAARASGAGWGHFQVCTLCSKPGLIVAGGFHGDMVIKRFSAAADEAPAYCRVTNSDNGITNGVQLCESTSGAQQILTSNNDSAVRLFDASSLKMATKFDFPWAVNYSTSNPLNPKMMCVAGDDPDVLLVDSCSGKTTHSLKGHLDYSFAAAWHPDGQVLATGNQDTTTRLWDIRHMGSAFATLKGRIGAIRSLRFSDNGKYLAMAEPADFVHIYDAASGYSKSQEIDLFGEIAGCAFSPDSETFFVSISDVTYSSLLQFHHKSNLHPRVLM